MFRPQYRAASNTGLPGPASCGNACGPAVATRTDPRTRSGRMRAPGTRCSTTDRDPRRALRRQMVRLGGLSTLTAWSMFGPRCFRASATARSRVAWVLRYVDVSQRTVKVSRAVPIRRLYADRASGVKLGLVPGRHCVMTGSRSRGSIVASPRYGDGRVLKSLRASEEGAMGEAERRAVSEKSVYLRHQATVARRRAVAVRTTAEMLVDGLARRGRSSAFSCPFLIRGGGGEPGQGHEELSARPEREGLPARLVCRSCGKEMAPGQSAIFVQTASIHLECLYPRSHRDRAGDGVFNGAILSVSDNNGLRIAWDHRCGRCGSTWRTEFIEARCPICKRQP